MHAQAHTRLLELMEQSLCVCQVLKQYSNENLRITEDTDDDTIIRAVRDREATINQLVNLEYRVDLILDEVDEFSYGDTLPPEVDRVRHTIRTVLSSVTEADMQAMQVISGRMQSYKNQTLKARNRKHLSAYMKAGLESGPSGTCDYKK